MMSDTRNSIDDATEPRLITSTDLFAAFAVKRRQYTLAYLAAHPMPVSITDLATFITRSELKSDDSSLDATDDMAERQLSHTNGRYTDRYERVLTDLYHVHLPHLSDAGLLTATDETELVELTVDRCVLSPYLDLAGVTVDLDSTTDIDIEIDGDSA
ncbi:DUF7344 domain-containing protein [Natrialba taiwanensis]|uniref:DUF7344 domain-containing protein n=1 Tax=Natrialba taiwanensis DSM 12281 TaxID=1230458 RepID=M0A1M7_9EURY|nr:hypothetical protein [Natrialba taiwanensis]ELY92655.1 hypothetical protein C484_08503 [Natrialba taiwanensis DSM 12281]